MNLIFDYKAFSKYKYTNLQYRNLTRLHLLFFMPYHVYFNIYSIYVCILNLQLFFVFTRYIKL